MIKQPTLPPEPSLLTLSLSNPKKECTIPAFLFPVAYFKLIPTPVTRTFFSFKAKLLRAQQETDLFHIR